MKRKLLVLWFFLMICRNRTASAYTDHDYPYETTSGCVETCTIDDLGFCQNNCTSYAAYVLKKVYGIDFSNSYGKVHWGHGGNWNDAAGKVKMKNDDGQMFDDEIIVDDNPIPGDVAYWEKDWTGDPKNHGDDYGHVAVVEKVHFDNNGNVTGINVSEYNYSPSCGFSDRGRNEEIIKISSADYPTGFIHILAYNEGVTGLYYLDCYEMDTLCDFQTKKEWTWILEKIAGYRCQNCEGRYMAEANFFYSDFGMGGGGDDKRKPLPNLKIQKMEVFDSEGNLLTKERSYLEVGKTYQIHVWPVSEKEDCQNGIREGKNTVETDTSWQIEDSPDGWRFLGRSYTQCKNLIQGDSKKEVLSFIVPPETAGKKVSFKSKVDSTDEVRETDERDNWSNQEWYPVKSISSIPVSPPLPISPSQVVLSWSSSGPKSGLFCTRFLEGADKDTWDDNYLCSNADIGLVWSSAGKVDNMRCTQIAESADPDTWWDNYLCVPNDSPFFFTWSSVGSISGLWCLQINEPAEPASHTWDDNYLCY